MTNFIIHFTDLKPLSIQEIGGKALSLCQLTHAGFPVPPGFVLSVAFFEPWIRTLSALPEWEWVQSATGETLQHATQSLQAHCKQLPFDPSQREQLNNALGLLRETTPASLFAVRSSSPEEDLDSASFAGGYETALGVNLSGLEDAIRHIFASCFDERVYLYKRQHGFPTHHPAIAVIVQAQVNADSAGVAFSLNPLNNCFDEVLINANHGLGESVVSGAVEPDVLVVDRVSRTLLETKPGRNGVVVRLNPEGGITQTQREPAMGVSLSPNTALRITGLTEQVEAFYQKPIDIEWAMAGEQIYLLQARPITTYLPLPEEMVTAPGNPKRLYANSTLIEQGLQEPLSVLGTDFLRYVLDKVGGPVAEGAVGPDGITFTAGGGYYMNISYAIQSGMNRAALAPGSMGDPQVTAILNNIDMQPYLAGPLPKKIKTLRSKMLFSMLPMAAGVAMAYLRPGAVLRKFQAALPEKLRRFDTLPGEKDSLKTQAVQLTSLLNFFYGEYGIPMILAAQISQQRIRGLFKQEADQVKDHLVNLGVALPGNKTTEMGEHLYTLAASEEIQTYPNAAAFLVALSAKSLSPAFQKAWEAYLQEFGMRCPGEIDPATPRPKEQPAVLFEQLKQMAQSIQSSDGKKAFFEEARAKRETAYRALYETALRHGKNKARAFQNFYRIWVTLGGYRETPKHYVIRVIDLFRTRALEIGRRFVVEGRLDRPEQIFDLTIEDIDRALGEPDLHLHKLAKKRTQLIDQIRRSRLSPRIIDSRGKIFYPPSQSAGDGVLRGTPISPGMVQGPAKILRYAAEKPVLPGDVLVTRATDPGWTPLFIHAGGIILEIGGALQHGAVVAREYGIPCVSGLTDATLLLKDGQMVEVDGSNGTVRILA